MEEISKILGFTLNITDIVCNHFWVPPIKIRFPFLALDRVHEIHINSSFEIDQLGQGCFHVWSFSESVLTILTTKVHGWRNF